jgi:hypothetical protein
VRHAIIFSIVQYFSGKCEWARTSQISAPARQRKRKALRLHLPVRLQQLPQRPPVHLRRKRRRAPPPLEARVLRLLSHKEGRSPVRRPRKQVRPRQRLPLGEHRLRHHRPRPPQRPPRALLLQPLRPEVQPLHRVRQLRGPSRPRACHQCIQLPGIMCIFIRRAVLTSIRICRPIVFFTKLAVSVTRVHQMRCSLPVPMRRLRDGRSFQLTMRNVLWRT